MEKYLVGIEFRYSDAPETEGRTTLRNKVVTIGVYDAFEDACKKGNDLLETLESKFELRQFPDGRKASKKRFSEKGGCFGGKETLVTGLSYLKTPFEFYAKIEVLNYNCIDEVINDAVNSSKRYMSYMSNESD